MSRRRFSISTGNSNYLKFSTGKAIDDVSYYGLEEMINILKKHAIVNNVFNSIAATIKDICTDMFNIDFDVIIVNMEGQILNGNYKSVIT